MPVLVEVLSEIELLLRRPLDVFYQLVVGVLYQLILVRALRVLLQLAAGLAAFLLVLFLVLFLLLVILIARLLLSLLILARDHFGLFFFLCCSLLHQSYLTFCDCLPFLAMDKSISDAAAL